MSQHTPAPWYVEGTIDGVNIICEENEIAQVFGPNPGSRFANANLMAAAPELLEALGKLANEASGFLALSDVERHGMTNSRILRDRIEQARDAMRKAAGLPTLRRRA